MNEFNAWNKMTQRPSSRLHNLELMRRNLINPKRDSIVRASQSESNSPPSSRPINTTKNIHLPQISEGKRPSHFYKVRGYLNSSRGNEASRQIQKNKELEVRKLRCFSAIKDKRIKLKFPISQSPDSLTDYEPNIKKLFRIPEIRGQIETIDAEFRHTVPINLFEFCPLKHAQVSVGISTD